MGSRQLTVVGKQMFGLNFAASGPSYTILGQRAYDTREAASGVLLVRVAAASGIPTGGSFVVAMQNTLIMPDDPATAYGIIGSGPSAVATAYVTIAAADSNFPRLYIAGFTSASTVPNGLQQVFVLYALYGSAAGSGSITMGVDVVFRDAS